MASCRHTHTPKLHELYANCHKLSELQEASGEVDSRRGEEEKTRGEEKRMRR